MTEQPIKGLIGCAECTDEPECAWHQLCLRKTPNPRGKNCQNGDPDVCKASTRDGVVCAEFECDIDSGVRADT